MGGEQLLPHHPLYLLVLLHTTLLMTAFRLPTILPPPRLDKDTLDPDIACQLLLRDLCRYHHQPRLLLERWHRTRQSHLVSHCRKDLHYRSLHLTLQVPPITRHLTRLAILPTPLSQCLSSHRHLPPMHLIGSHTHSARRSYTLMISTNIQIPMHNL